MKLVQTSYLISSGDFPKSEEWESLFTDIDDAIAAVSIGTTDSASDFSALPSKAEAGMTPFAGNREKFRAKLGFLGWNMRFHLDEAQLPFPRSIDAAWFHQKRALCAEWGARSIGEANSLLNKLALGILKGTLIGGALIVSDVPECREREASGVRWRDIEPYFDLWRCLRPDDGVLVVLRAQ